MASPIPENVCQEAVYKSLYLAHAREVRNFLLYKGATVTEAEDLTQEAFLRLWRDCQKVPQEKVKGYLFTVAGNLFLDARKHDQVVLRFQRRQVVEPDHQDPHFNLETSELQQSLENAIAGLPEKQRVVFLMNRMDRLTYAEIAERLDLSVKAVEKRMSLALTEIRKTLKNI